MIPPTLTRRRLLSGLGASGVASLAGFGLLTDGAKGFTNTTTIQSFDGVTLTADWRETYNGTVLEDTTDGLTETGAVLSLQDVMPGDNGVLSVRLSLESTSEDDNPDVDPRLTLSLTETAENGLSEPESVVGDDTPDTGELQEFLQTAVWYDGGLANIDVFGANNGVQDFGEGLVADGAEGTLAEVADAVDNVSLTPGGCLSVGERVTISLGWSFESDATGINEAQGDSVVFDCLVTAEQCGGNQ